jgi:hypothetical protein
MLILSSSGFFSSPTGAEADRDWKLVMGQRSQQTAEFSIILYALRKVEERWRQFNEYIGSLLVEDFMDPEAYTELLFDNETFSRSKLYFWAIGCLNEFTISIEDNIKQVKFFRKARIPYSPNSPAMLSLPEELQTFDDEARKIGQSLEDLKAQFEAKLVTIQTLRDGVSGFPPSLSLSPQKCPADEFHSFSMQHPFGKRRWLLDCLRRAAVRTDIFLSSLLQRCFTCLSASLRLVAFLCSCICFQVTRY